MTSIIFNYVSQGSVEVLKQELLKMGVHKPDAIANMIDDE